MPTTNTNAIPAGASAPAEDPRLNLRELFQRQKACGYDTDLTLDRISVQNIALNVRASEAVLSVLLAGEGLDIDLSAYTRSGLIEAVYRLTEDTTLRLDRANDRAERLAGGAA